MALYSGKGAEGVVQMFYAIAKRRRDLNAAEERGYKKGLEIGRAEARAKGYAEGYAKGWAEGYLAGFIAVLDEAEARFSEPGADPMAVIAQMRAELQNGAGQ